MVSVACAGAEEMEEADEPLYSENDDLPLELK